MSKAGRNDPCPCGSGKKFKKCCLPTEQAAASEKLIAAHREREILEASMRKLGITHRQLEQLAEGPLELLDDGLDDLSNGVLDLIREGRLDEALVDSRRLLDEYPDVHDGFEMSALVHDAMGKHAEAADFWRRAIEFVEHPSRRPEYDDEVLEDFREQMQKSISRAQEPAATLRAPSAEDERAP